MLRFFQIHMINSTGDMITVVNTVAVPSITAKMIRRQAVKKLFMNGWKHVYVE